MSGEPDVFAEADDPIGHPSMWDNFIRKWIAQGYTDEEAAEACRFPSQGGKPWPRAAWRMTLLRVAAIRRLMVGEAVADTPPEGKMTLSRADVLRGRQGWQRGDGHPWVIAGPVSEATYLRARHRYGLVPWPAKYRSKVKG